MILKLVANLMFIAFLGGLALSCVDRKTIKMPMPNRVRSLPERD